jgi:uncharacterized Ntn-hydrolase superfamily protein
MKNLAHTFSIVARDPQNGHLGVAVQSHWFAVGALCPWIEAGVGAIATQSLVDPSYGALGLNLLRSGSSAIEVLDDLLKKDKNRENRQVAIVDSSGHVTTHTGANCVAEAGHISGNGFSVQANMMKYPTVWTAMANAFEKSTGDLADRLMTALLAAQSEGGDIRGKQSAALLVVDDQKTDKPWEHILINIRVDDNPEPLVELERLLNIQRAYHLMNEGDELLGKKDFEAAMHKYQAAEKFAPNIDEIPFWVAVTLADSDKMEKALPIFERIFKINPDWAETVKRLPKAGFLRNDQEMMEKILALLK